MTWLRWSFVWAVFARQSVRAARTKERWWNPDEPKLLTPKVFGWGWDLNLARLLGRKPKH